MASTTATLSKADEKKLGTYDFHAPNDPSGYHPAAFGLITIYKRVLNAKGDGLKTTSVGRVRFRRRDTELAVKTARRVVKDLNNGTQFALLFPACGVISVSSNTKKG
jgi:hypothetical protein